MLSAVRSPWLFRPDISTRISRNATLTIAAGVTSRLLGLRLSANEYFRIEGLGFGGDSLGVVDFSDLVFSLRIDGVRHPNFGNLSDQLGTVADMTDVDIRLAEPSSLIEVLCTNNDGVDPATVSARWVGWTFPLEVLARAQ